jgi:phosphocarrier protein
MITWDVVVTGALGIHARPSGLISRTALRFKSNITITNKLKNVSVDAKSILSIMTLAATQGTTLTLKIDGPDEYDALKSILYLFETEFEQAY